MNTYKSSIDKRILDIFKKKKTMGSIAVSQNSEIIYLKQFGYSDVSKGYKINAETKFRIGSITKTFTAALCFKAIENGKLKLTNKLDSFLPNLKFDEAITIKHLLMHRSGVHNFTDDKEYMKYETKRMSRKDMANLMRSMTQDFSPNNKMSYSNSNYILLNLILEEIYGLPFQKIIEAEIVKPLQLSRTGYGRKIDSNKNEAHSYSYRNKWIISTETHPSIPLGAGGMVSTPKDLLRFFQALKSGIIISQKNYKKMKVFKENYGMGLMLLDSYSSKNLIGHLGGIDEFTSVLGYSEEDDICIAVCLNASRPDTVSALVPLLIDLNTK